MHPRVRELYKELIFTAAHYNALPLQRCRDKIKTNFFKNKTLEIDSEEWKKALAWGRFEIKQMKAMHEIRVYRQMKSKYEDPRTESSFPVPFSEYTKPKQHVPKERRGGGGGSSGSGTTTGEA